jgi:hypothetical protein
MSCLANFSSFLVAAADQMAACCTFSLTQALLILVLISSRSILLDSIQIAVEHMDACKHLRAGLFT